MRLIFVERFTARTLDIQTFTAFFDPLLFLQEAAGTKHSELFMYGFYLTSFHIYSLFILTSKNRRKVAQRERPELMAALDYARDGDVIVV